MGGMSFDGSSETDPTNPVLVMLEVVISLLFLSGLVTILIRWCYLCRRRRGTEVLPHIQTIEPKKTLRQTLTTEEFDQYLPKSSYDHSLNKYQSSACVICLEEFTAQSEVREIPMCNHIFHATCIEEWLDRDERCPDCRHNVTVAEFEALKKPSGEKKDDAQMDQKPNTQPHVAVEIPANDMLRQETHLPEIPSGGAAYPLPLVITPYYTVTFAG